MEALWQDIWKGVQADFSDLPDAEAVTQLMLRMLLAILLGGILGYQRERQGKEAGVRTHMLVALHKNKSVPFCFPFCLLTPPPSDGTWASSLIIVVRWADHL